MASPSLTPNIGLQIPGYNQANWQVPIVYDLNRIDNVFGGSIQVPALNVVNLTVENLIASNVSALIVSLINTSIAGPVGSLPATQFEYSNFRIRRGHLSWNPVINWRAI